MADSNSTKSALADAMKKLMVCKSFAKISISDLCEECGLNRKSFYYHFKDKYDLVNWIFYVDFLTNMGGKNFENEWDVLVAVCNIFYQNKAFYQSALRIEGQNSFKDYFYEMLEPVMAFFVQDLFQVQNQKLFVTFFCDAFLTAVLRWFRKHKILPDKYPVLIGKVIEKIILICPATPYTNHIHIGFLHVTEQSLIAFRSNIRQQCILRNIISSFGKHRYAIDFK